MDTSELIASLSKTKQLGMTIADFRASLPVAKHRRALLYLVEKHPVVIVVGHTGCGKTTQIPQYLYETGWADDGKMIGCTQPRRVAATSVACRVAEEMDCTVGDTVGYAVRFEDRTSPSTRIKYMTDGVLFREAMFDPFLSKYSVIMVDEAHERSLHTDLILALLKKIMRKRPELKVIIASATLEAERFMEYFRVIGRSVGAVSGPTMPPPRMVASMEEDEEEATEEEGEFKVTPSKEPVALSLEGKPFPLSIFHLAEPCEDVVEAAVSTILAIDREEGPGDILAFLSGKAEIDLALELLADALSTSRERHRRLAAFPLHASMSTNRQLEAFQPVSPGTRKVILSTNIAEASVTIEGIVYVVDGGQVKRRVHLLSEGIDSMQLMRISKAAAIQRAGRAGRCQPGKVYRLYTEAEYDQMIETSPPELKMIDLTTVVLQLKALRIDDAGKFDFVDKPTEGQLIRARENLKALGAIDDHGGLTADVGVILSELPLDPRLGKMLLAAQSKGCVGEMLSIVAILAVGGGPSLFLSDIQADVKRKQSVHEGDLVSYLNIYNAFLENRGNASKWCARHGLSAATLEKAHNFRAGLADQLRHFGLATMNTASVIEVHHIQQCIIAGLFMNLAILDEAKGSYRHVRAASGLQRRELWLHPDSVLFKVSPPPPLVVWVEALETTKAFLREVTVVRKDWLYNEAPHYYQLTRR